jgi:predicted amidohydrolase
MTFIAACLQLNSQDDIQANISHIAPLFQEAVKARASLVLLPENAFSMVPHGGKSEVRRFSMEDHPGLLWAQEIAKQHAKWVLVGSVAIAGQDERRRLNRSVLINDQGQVTAAYDKIHLFDVEVGDGQTYSESSRIEPGDRTVVADAPWGKIGLSVCYDVRFPQLYRSLAKSGADFLTVPSAFTYVTGSAHWHVLLRARAIENGCFVFAPAQCGEHPGGRRTYGHSLIIDPWGRILAEAPEGKPGIITADIDISQVQAVRRRIPSLSHDRKFV